MSEGDADVGEGIWARETAPQSPYTGRQVGIGFVVLIVGAVVAFGLPIATTLG